MPVDRSDDARPSPGRRPPTDAPADDLAPRSVAVSHESTPDRRAVYPDGVAAHERLTRCPSADDDAFVDLDAIR